MEILKIMDKQSFSYDLDIGPENHIYYYVSACILELRGQKEIDIEKTIHYFINIMIIVYRNSESFEMLPKIFYLKIFELIQIIHKNKSRTKYVYKPHKHDVNYIRFKFRLTI